MRGKKSKFGPLIALFGLCLAPALQAQQPAADQTKPEQPSAEQSSKEQISVLTLVGRPLPIVVGEMRGTFARYGLEVKTQNFANSGLMRKALADGTGNLAYAAVDNAVAMAELSGANVEIVSGGEGSQNELIVQPEIKSIEDLRGKTVLVDAVNTAYALQLKGILLLHGMRVGRDYELNAFGATPLRLKALVEHKELTGSMLPPPFSIEARRSGLVSLASVPAVLGAYQAGGHFAERQWAQQHRDSLVKYLAAYIESQRWLMEPDHKQQVIDLIMKENHLEREIAEETYTLSVTRPGGFEKDARLDPEGFKNVLKLRADVEGQWNGQPPPPDKYYDSSYYDAALAKIQ